MLAFRECGPKPASPETAPKCLHGSLIAESGKSACGPGFASTAFLGRPIMAKGEAKWDVHIMT